MMPNMMQMTLILEGSYDLGHRNILLVIHMTINSKAMGCSGNVPVVSLCLPGVSLPFFPVQVGIATQTG